MRSDEGLKKILLVALAWAQLFSTDFGIFSKSVFVFTHSIAHAQTPGEVDLTPPDVLLSEATQTPFAAKHSKTFESIAQRIDKVMFFSLYGKTNVARVLGNVEVLDAQSLESIKKSVEDFVQEVQQTLALPAATGLYGAEEASKAKNPLPIEKSVVLELYGGLIEKLALLVGTYEVHQTQGGAQETKGGAPSKSEMIARVARHMDQPGLVLRVDRERFLEIVYVASQGKGGAGLVSSSLVAADTDECGGIVLKPNSLNYHDVIMATRARGAHRGDTAFFNYLKAYLKHRLEAELLLVSLHRPVGTFDYPGIKEKQTEKLDAVKRARLGEFVFRAFRDLGSHHKQPPMFWPTQEEWQNVLRQLGAVPQRMSSAMFAGKNSLDQLDRFFRGLWHAGAWPLLKNSAVGPHGLTIDGGPEAELEKLRLDVGVSEYERQYRFNARIVGTVNQIAPMFSIRMEALEPRTRSVFEIQALVKDVLVQAIGIASADELLGVDEMGQPNFVFEAKDAITRINDILDTETEKFLKGSRSSEIQDTVSVWSEQLIKLWDAEFKDGISKTAHDEFQANLIKLGLLSLQIERTPNDDPAFVTDNPEFLINMREIDKVISNTLALGPELEGNTTARVWRSWILLGAMGQPATYSDARGKFLTVLRQLFHGAGLPGFDPVHEPSEAKDRERRKAQDSVWSMMAKKLGISREAAKDLDQSMTVEFAREQIQKIKSLPPASSPNRALDRLEAELAKDRVQSLEALVAWGELLGMFRGEQDSQGKQTDGSPKLVDLPVGRYMTEIKSHLAGSVVRDKMRIFEEEVHSFGPGRNTHTLYDSVRRRVLAEGLVNRNAPLWARPNVGDLSWYYAGRTYSGGDQEMFEASKRWLDADIDSALDALGKRLVAELATVEKATQIEDFRPLIVHASEFSSQLTQNQPGLKFKLAGAQQKLFELEFIHQTLQENSHRAMEYGFTPMLYFGGAYAAARFSNVARKWLLPAVAAACGYDLAVNGKIAPSTYGLMGAYGASLFRNVAQPFMLQIASGMRPAFELYGRLMLYQIALDLTYGQGAVVRMSGQQYDMVKRYHGLSIYDRSFFTNEQLKAAEQMRADAWMGLALNTGLQAGMLGGFHVMGHFFAETAKHWAQASEQRLLDVYSRIVGKAPEGWQGPPLPHHMKIRDLYGPHAHPMHLRESMALLRPGFLEADATGAAFAAAERELQAFYRGRVEAWENFFRDVQTELAFVQPGNSRRVMQLVMPEATTQGSLMPLERLALETVRLQGDIGRAQAMLQAGKAELERLKRVGDKSAGSRRELSVPGQVEATRLTEEEAAKLANGFYRKRVDRPEGALITQESQMFDVLREEWLWNRRVDDVIDDFTKVLSESQIARLREIYPGLPWASMLANKPALHVADVRHEVMKALSDQDVRQVIASVGRLSGRFLSEFGMGNVSPSKTPLLFSVSTHALADVMASQNHVLRNAEWSEVSRSYIRTQLAFDPRGGLR